MNDILFQALTVLTNQGSSQDEITHASTFMEEAMQSNNSEFVLSLFQLAVSCAQSNIKITHSALVFILKTVISSSWNFISVSPHLIPQIQNYLQVLITTVPPNYVENVSTLIKSFLCPCKFTQNGWPVLISFALEQLQGSKELLCFNLFNAIYDSLPSEIMSQCSEPLIILAINSLKSPSGIQCNSTQTIIHLSAINLLHQNFDSLMENLSSSTINFFLSSLLEIFQNEISEFRSIQESNHFFDFFADFLSYPNSLDIDSYRETVFELVFQFLGSNSLLFSYKTNAFHIFERLLEVIGIDLGDTLIESFLKASLMLSFQTTSMLSIEEIASSENDIPYQYFVDFLWTFSQQFHDIKGFLMLNSLIHEMMNNISGKENEMHSLLCALFFESIVIENFVSSISISLGDSSLQAALEFLYQLCIKGLSTGFPNAIQMACDIIKTIASFPSLINGLIQSNIFAQIIQIVTQFTDNPAIQTIYPYLLRTIEAFYNCFDTIKNSSQILSNITSESTMSLIETLLGLSTSQTFLWKEDAAMCISAALRFVGPNSFFEANFNNIAGKLVEMMKNGDDEAASSLTILSAFSICAPNSFHSSALFLSQISSQVFFAQASLIDENSDTNPTFNLVESSIKLFTFAALSIQKTQPEIVLSVIDPLEKIITSNFPHNYNNKDQYDEIQRMKAMCLRFLSKLITFPAVFSQSNLIDKYAEIIIGFLNDSDQSQIIQAAAEAYTNTISFLSSSPHIINVIVERLVSIAEEKISFDSNYTSSIYKALEITFITKVSLDREILDKVFTLVYEVFKIIDDESELYEAYSKSIIPDSAFDMVSAMAQNPELAFDPKLSVYLINLYECLKSFDFHQSSIIYSILALLPPDQSARFLQKNLAELDQKMSISSFLGSYYDKIEKLVKKKIPGSFDTIFLPISISPQEAVLRVSEDDTLWIQEKDFQNYLVTLAREVNLNTIPELLGFSEAKISIFERHMSL